MCVKRLSNYRVVTVALDSRSRVWGDTAGSATDLSDDLDQTASFCKCFVYWVLLHPSWLWAFTVFWRTAFSLCLYSLQQIEPVIFSRENLNTIKSCKQQKDHSTEREKINGIWGSRNFKLTEFQIYHFLALK